jgi:hypothetical protein
VAIASLIFGEGDSAAKVVKGAVSELAPSADAAKKRRRSIFIAGLHHLAQKRAGQSQTRGEPDLL